MTGRTIEDHAASIRARLFAHTRATDDDFQRVLTRYATERLLFRLSRTDYAERFMLKGATLFATSPKHAHRRPRPARMGKPGPGRPQESFRP